MPHNLWLYVQRNLNDPESFKLLLKQLFCIWGIFFIMANFSSIPETLKANIFINKVFYI